MDVKNTTYEIIEEINELKAIVMKEISKEDVFKDMNPEGIIALQKSLQLIDTSCRLMKEYAEILESQDKKLDMILEKLEEKV